MDLNLLGSIIDSGANMTGSKQSRQTKHIDHAIPQALLDLVIATYKKPADLIGENGLRRQMTTAVIEAALNAEMAEYLGHDPPAHERARACDFGYDFRFGRTAAIIIACAPVAQRVGL